MSERIEELTWGAWKVGVDHQLGHLWVEHDGTITWDDLQAIKNELWGTEARAIEIYPAASAVVNSRPCRHLWRLGEHEFAPDLLGEAEGTDDLQSRWMRAWAQAHRSGA